MFLKRTKNINLVFSDKFFQIRRYLLAFVLGMLYTVSFPRIYFVPATPLAFMGLSILFIDAKNLKEAIKLGFIGGMGFGIIGFYWFMFAIQYSTSSSILGFLGVIASSLIISIFFILIAFLSYYSPKTKAWQLLFYNAAIWGAIELLRGKFLFSGFPWFIAASYWDFDIYMMQTASLVGSYGLGFITYLIFTGLVILPLNTKKITKIQIWLFLGFIIISLHIFGLYRVNYYKSIEETSNRVVIFQPNVNQQEKIEGIKEKEHLQELIVLSKVLSERFHNLLIIWPETAINLFSYNYNQLIKDLKNNLKNNAMLASGILRVDEKGNYYNSVIIYNSKNGYSQYYDKNILVPFGEYIPITWMFNNKNSIVANFNFTKGVLNPYFVLNEKYKFKTNVCYEGIFLNKNLNNKNLNFLVNVANDGWYNNSMEPYQHLSLTRFRAIEGGIPLLRSTNFGISAVIDSVGNIKKYIQVNHKGYIISYIPDVYPKITLFSYIGNSLNVLVIFAILIYRFGCMLRGFFERRKRVSKSSN